MLLCLVWLAKRTHTHTNWGGKIKKSTSSDTRRLEPFYQTYPEFASTKKGHDFAPLRIKQFEKGCRLSVQHRKSGPVIGVYDPARHMLSLYDVDHLDRHPMFEYKIASAQVHHFTERFIFSLSVGRHQNRISIISNLLATARHHSSVKVYKDKQG